MTLHDLTALEQAAAIRKCELSPVELTDHYLGRIDRLNHLVAAFVTVTADRARAEAQAAQAALVARRQVPPLHGVPIAIKDLTATAGVRTMSGSALYRDMVPATDAHVVSLLRRAGTISLGKTNTPEFGLPAYTESLVAEPARTPWDLTRGAGGSSGGAAAAVAAGLVPFAQGSDGGGSIRIPASVCGLVGLKVARGRISGGPQGGDLTGLAQNGPIARTVRDAAAMLDAMAVAMPGDPHWAPPLPPGETFLAWCERSAGRLRIGRHRTPIIADVPVHPDCVAAWEDVSRKLAALGHQVEDVTPPFGPAITPAFTTLWSVTAAARELPPADLARLTPLTRWLRDRGAAKSGAEFVNALSAVQRASREWITATAEYDAILTPTLAQPPVPVGYFTASGDPARDFALQEAVTPFTSVCNMTGLPAITLPLHWSAEGLPIGVMLIGRPAGEGPLLALAAQLEGAHPWKDRHPPVW